MMSDARSPLSFLKNLAYAVSCSQPASFRIPPSAGCRSLKIKLYSGWRKTGRSWDWANPEPLL